MDPADKLYYHGTWNEYAYAIMTQGFKLGVEGHGQRLGRGIYIAQRLASAANWSHHIVIACRLRPATRILWIQEGYDRGVMRYLEREFGKELTGLGPHFHRAIPANKQLTRRELIALCNYIFEIRQKKRWQYGLKQSKGRRATYWAGWENLSRLHEQVRRHGFDALGDRSFAEWDSDEILVFNPARVTSVSAHWLRADREYENFSLGPPLDLDRLKQIAAAGS